MRCGKQVCEIHGEGALSGWAFGEGHGHGLAVLGLRVGSVLAGRSLPRGGVPVRQSPIGLELPPPLPKEAGSEAPIFTLENMGLFASCAMEDLNQKARAELTFSAS